MQFCRRYFQAFDQFMMPKVPGLFQRSAFNALAQIFAASDQPAAAVSLEASGLDTASFTDPQLQLQNIAAERFAHPRLNRARIA